MPVETIQMVLTFIFRYVPQTYYIRRPSAIRKQRSKDIAIFRECKIDSCIYMVREIYFLIGMLAKASESGLHIGALLHHVVVFSSRDAAIS